MTVTRRRHARSAQLNVLSSCKTALELRAVCYRLCTPASTHQRALAEPDESAVSCSLHELQSEH